MRAQFVRGGDPKKTMKIGMQRFETFQEAGEYAFEHMEEITGFSEPLKDPEDPDQMGPKQYERLVAWFNQIKKFVDEENYGDDVSFESFWGPFIEDGPPF
jgi:hypothetical protein